MERFRNAARQTSIVLAVGAVLVSGCAGDTPPRVETRDSTGIRVVESGAVDPDAATGWSVVAAPRLSLGVEDGAEQYQFSRIGGVARLDDGKIAVGDGGSSQLRLYDSAGVFLAAVGRLGQGPGEFGEFSSLRIWRAPNGEILVNDSGNDRINVFDPGGWYLRGVRLAAAPNGPRVFLVDVFADGTWLTAAPEGGGRLDASVVGPLAPMQFAYHRYSSTGEYIGGILNVADRPRYVNEYGGSRHFPYIPLTLSPQFAVRDSSVFVYRGPVAELEQWSAGGNVWVRRYRLPWETAQRWDILAPEGNWLTTIETPERVTVAQVGRDFILGTHRDSLGVERVQLFGLTMRAASPPRPRAPEASS